MTAHTRGRIWMLLMPSRSARDRRAGGGSGVARVERVEVLAEPEQPGLVVICVDEYHGPGPGVLQVGGVRLLRAQVGLIDPRAGVPIAPSPGRPGDTVE